MTGDGATMAARPRRPAAAAAATTVAVLVADQVTKHLVVNSIEPREVVDLPLGIRLVHVTNRGVAFSLGNGRGGVAVLVVVLVGVLAFVVRRELSRPAGDPEAPGVGAALAFGAILGGALGNLLDRLFRGAGWGRGGVVDFVDLRFWPVFNVADAALTLGCVALVLRSLRAGAGDAKDGGPDAADGPVVGPGMDDAGRSV